MKLWIPALLVGVLCAAGAVAHTQNGSLGATASSTDFYQITCLDDGSGTPVSLGVEIEDAAPAAPPLVSVQIQRGLLIVSVTDRTDGDGQPSTEVFLNGGPGVYDVLIDKTAAGAENYTLDFHCFTGPDGTGIHTGTSIVTRQNQ